jgi:hypothetical protein
MSKDNLRITIGTSLMFMIALVSYMVIPFLWVYGFAVIVSIIAMIIDATQNDPKQGMIIYILKWTTLIPVLNLIPLLLIPVFSIVNLFFKD